jgi:hypothetical protein
VEWYLHHFLHILTLHLDIALAHIIPYAMDYISCAVGLINYEFQCGTNLLTISGGGEVATGIGVIAYRSERLADRVDECEHRMTGFDKALKSGDFCL